jgi:hypothetical protein
MDNWVDVQQNRDKYEKDFHIPTMEELQSLESGDTVKVSDQVERFFVLVMAVSTDTITGKIMNHLIGNQGYNYQDMITFEKRHVFSIQKRRPISKETRLAHRMMNMLGSHNDEGRAILTILRGMDTGKK